MLAAARAEADSSKRSFRALWQRDRLAAILMSTEWHGRRLLIIPHRCTSSDDKGLDEMLLDCKYKRTTRRSIERVPMLKQLDKKDQNDGANKRDRGQTEQTQCERRTRSQENETTRP